MTEAQALTVHLGGRWHGHYGCAPCPVCQPERRATQMALTLTDCAQGLLLHCKKAGCAFRDIVRAVGLHKGDYRSPDPAIVARREAQRRAEVARRQRQAQAIWRAAEPIWGTIAEKYLRARGVSCELPASLRFHHGTWHAATRQHLPAMLACVEGGNGFAVHRTYLRPDGIGKAPVDPAKAMLAPTAGGAVRLSNGPGPLVVAEGVETALSLRCGLLDEPFTVWAALSTTGMRRLALPPRPEELIVACDGDEPGRVAANCLADRARALGWRVSILDPGTGRDFNDLLCGKGAA